MHDFLFPYNIDINCYSDTASNGNVKLSQLIGFTLSEMLRYKECPLELIRINKNGYKLVAMRRYNDISVDIIKK